MIGAVAGGFYDLDRRPQLLETFRRISLVPRGAMFELTARGAERRTEA